MTTGTCVVISTLVVVSLANLLLLVHLIMDCGNNQQSLSTKVRNYLSPNGGNRYQPRKYPKIQKRQDSVPNITLAAKQMKFMGILILYHEETMEFACGVAVISRNWVLVPKNCWDSIHTYPKEFIQVVATGNDGHSNFHNIDVVVNVGKGEVGAVLSVFPFFKSKTTESIALAGKNYKYVSNSTAVVVGWRRTQGDEYVLDQNVVKLTWYKLCELHYGGSYGNGMVCATQHCSKGHAFLVQNFVLIGIVVQQTPDCYRPGLFFKVAQLQNVLESVQKTKKISFNIVFKR